MKPIDEMSPDEVLIELRELRREVFVDPITQIANRTAWNEMEKGPALAWIDADGPEDLADENCRALCERPLQAIAAALQEAIPNSVAYFYGDIFVAHAQNPMDLECGIARALRLLSNARIQMTRPDGAMTVLHGLAFSYAQAGDLREAEFALQYIKRGEQRQGFALPAGTRLPDRLKPLLRLGYRVSQVRLTMPDGTAKDF